MWPVGKRQAAPRMVSGPISPILYLVSLNFFFFYAFILLCWVLVVARGTFVAAYEVSFLASCGILVPQPGIQPASPALEGGLNHWTIREVPF